MKIIKVKPKSDYTLQVIIDDGRTGIFDVRPYLKFEAFTELKDQNAFMKIMNGGYFLIGFGKEFYCFFVPSLGCVFL